jgi:hypothetical protein
MATLHHTMLLGKWRSGRRSESSVPHLGGHLALDVPHLLPADVDHADGAVRGGGGVDRQVVHTGTK